MNDLIKKPGYGTDFYYYIPISETEGVHVNVTDTREVFLHGAKKYKDFGFEAGNVMISNHFYACLRHLWRWFINNNLDKETKQSHLHHAHCRLLMMMYQEQQGLNDDRLR